MLCTVGGVEVELKDGIEICHVLCYVVQVSYLRDTRDANHYDLLVVITILAQNYAITIRQSIITI